VYRASAAIRRTTILLTVLAPAVLIPPAPLRHALREGKPADFTPLAGRVYPLSVVEGGIHSAVEAQHRTRTDAVVRRHYADIDLSLLKGEYPKAELKRYVSYRRGDRIYWTSKPLTVGTGEMVFTDGRNEVRGRCGNRLSESPQ
jgi:hypothetical protein